MRPLLLLFVLAPLAASAQPIRWGKVSDAERAVTEVAGDPDAAAIVLGDVAQDEVLPDARGRLRYTRRRHRRVKVLSEAGYEQGEFALRHSDDDRVRDVRGQTWVPRPDGEWDRVELDRTSVFREEVRDGVEEVRFTMPALAPGAIVEFSYTIESESITALAPWSFQSDEPTLVSEYTLEAPSVFEYVSIAQGAIETALPQRRAQGQFDVVEYRWTARDLPALRDEPYTTTETDYQTRIALQLNRYTPPRRPTEQVLSTWPDLAETLDDHSAFGRRLRSSKLRRAQVEGLTGSRDERARAVYDMVRTGYVSDGRGGIFADRDLNDVVETRSGTDPELTLLLAALLRDADVPARLALLSTRANGQPTQLYPIVGQFDRVAVLATMEDGTFVYLDPTDPNRPFGVLPVASLNGVAWLADPDGPAWMSVPPTPGTSTTTYVRGTLDAGGPARRRGPAPAHGLRRRAGPGRDAGVRGRRADPGREHRRGRLRGRRRRRRRRGHDRRGHRARRPGGPARHGRPVRGPGRRGRRRRDLPHAVRPDADGREPVPAADPDVPRRLRLPVLADLRGVGRAARGVRAGGGPGAAPDDAPRPGRLVHPRHVGRPRPAHRPRGPDGEPGPHRGRGVPGAPPALRRDRRGRGRGPRARPRHGRRRGSGRKPRRR